MPKRPCLGLPGKPCGTLTNGTRCEPCRLAKQRTRDTHRPTPTQRGYGPEHQRLRQHWQPKVQAGVVDCARCGQRIQPDTPWDLGHTDDRTTWTGPEHAAECNRRAGGASTPRTR